MPHLQIKKFRLAPLVIYSIDMEQEKWHRQLISEEKIYSSLIFNPLNNEEILVGTSEGLTTFNIPQTISEEANVVPPVVSVNTNIRFDNYSQIKISPDGTRIAKRDNKLLIWNLKTGGVYIPKTGTLLTTAVDWEHDLLAYSSDYDIIIVNLKTGEKTIQLIGHKSLVRDISFHPTEPLLVSGININDETVQIWNYETGQKIRSFLSPNGGYLEPQFNPQGTLLAIETEVWGLKNCP